MAIMQSPIATESKEYPCEARLSPGSPGVARAECYTLLDPDVFCLDGETRSSERNSRQMRKGAALGFSAAARALALSRAAAVKTTSRVLGPIAATASAGITTASMVKNEGKREDQRLRIHQAVQLFFSNAGVEWDEYINDIMMEDLDSRSEIATAVGAVGDYISAGSAFLLLFPPVAAAGFVTGIAIMAGGEVGKSSERKLLQNIYDLITRSITHNIVPAQIDALWCLLQERGLSARGGHRLEVWAFCRALERFKRNQNPRTRDCLLNWLEEQLLVSIDALRKSEEFTEQCNREFIPALMDGQITVSRMDRSHTFIERLQVPAFDESKMIRHKTDWVGALKGRLISDIEKLTNENRGSDPLDFHKAAERALAAAMADFDSASMMATKIAYRLYIDTSEESEAIACVDEDAYRDCHFVTTRDTIQVMRCGVFKIKSADSDTPTAYIPYMRSVIIPLGANVERITERFDFLSGKWFSSASSAAQQLPQMGIPTPFVQWRTAPPAFIEDQMLIFSEGLEKALATGPYADVALTEYLQMGKAPNMDDVQQSNRRAFIAPPKEEPRRLFRKRSGSKWRPFSRSKRSGMSTLEECLAAATFLVQACGYAVDANTLSMETLESMISVRQKMLRGSREFLAQVLPPNNSDRVVKCNGQSSWKQTVRDEFEAVLDGLEERTLEYINHMCLRQMEEI